MKSPNPWFVLPTGLEQNAHDATASNARLRSIDQDGEFDEALIDARTRLLFRDISNVCKGREVVVVITATMMILDCALREMPKGVRKALREGISEYLSRRSK